MSAQTILLFTADPQVVRVAREAVRAIRHSLKIIPSAAEGSRQLDHETANVDAMIIDVDPGMDGPKLLTTAARQAPVIVLTSHEEDCMDSVFRRRGAQRCLVKPLTVQRLVEAIEEVLGATTSI